MSLCGAFCNTGAKRATLTRRSGRNWRIAKICSMSTHYGELTVNAVLPGIRSLLADLRAQQISVGLASVSLNAPTILAALELREFFTFCADASQLKNSKPDPEIFLAACAGLGVPPQACIGIEDAQAGIDAINASGMRSVGIGAGLTGAQLLLPSTESLTWPRLSAFWQNV